jgi:hypothetical protein
VCFIAFFFFYATYIRIIGFLSVRNAFFSLCVFERKSMCKQASRLAAKKALASSDTIMEER